jgi:hypothetical protein
LSGPDGVTSHGRWLYGGDGNSTLKVFDLLAPTGGGPTLFDRRSERLRLNAAGEQLVSWRRKASRMRY